MPWKSSNSPGTAETLVFDTGPLIALSRGGALQTVGRLPYRKVAPVEVQVELARGIELGHPPVIVDWMEWLSPREALGGKRLPSLGRGEAAAIALALELEARAVVLDDLKARARARADGIAVVGALGLLARCKVLGYLPKIRPVIGSMLDSGAWFSEELIESILKGVGELEE